MEGAGVCTSNFECSNWYLKKGRGKGLALQALHPHKLCRRCSHLDLTVLFRIGKQPCIWREVAGIAAGMAGGWRRAAARASGCGGTCRRLTAKPDPASYLSFVQRVLRLRRKLSGALGAGPCSTAPLMPR